MGYETINIKNVDTIVVYEKDEDTAAMLEVELLHSFMLELDKENSVFMRALAESISHNVSSETLEKLVAAHLLQQQYAIRSHVYEYS